MPPRAVVFEVVTVEDRGVVLGVIVVVVECLVTVALENVDVVVAVLVVLAVVTCWWGCMA